MSDPNLTTANVAARVAETLEAKLQAALAPAVKRAENAVSSLNMWPPAGIGVKAEMKRTGIIGRIKAAAYTVSRLRAAIPSIKGFSPMGFLSFLRLGSVSPYLIAVAVLAASSFAGGWHVKSRLDEATIANMKIAAMKEADRQTQVGANAVAAAGVRERAAVKLSKKDAAIIRRLRFSKDQAPGCALSPADANQLGFKK